MGSLKSRAQNLVKACWYDQQAAETMNPERCPHDCGYLRGDSCSYCDDFPGAEFEAEADERLKWRDKALKHTGSHADVLAVLQADPVVMAAATRTARLLGAETGVNVHAFGPGWRELGLVGVR